MFSAFFSDAKGADAAADAVCLSFYLSLLFLKEFALSFGGDPVQEVGPDVGMFARLVNALFKYRQLIFALIIIDIEEQIWTDVLGEDLMAFDATVVDNFFYFGDDSRWEDCFDQTGELLPVFVVASAVIARCNLGGLSDPFFLSSRYCQLFNKFVDLALLLFHGVDDCALE